MASVDGIWCCLGAAVLYFIGSSHGREADALNSVTRVNQLNDLTQLLEAASKVMPLVVAVSGRDGSNKPINSENSGLRVVILERTNDEGSWVKDSALLLSRRREVDWYLDDGTGRVDVLEARGARGFVLTGGSDVFEESRPGTLDNIPGLKILGIREVERVLPTGKLLTVVGENYIEQRGDYLDFSLLLLRMTSDQFESSDHRMAYFVSDKTIDELITSSGSYARFLTYAPVGLAVLGIYILAKNAIQHVRERRRRKRVLDDAKKSQQQEAGLNYKAKNESDCPSRDRARPDLCVICLEHEYNSLFVPCGHMCCCVACSSRLTNCPLCRRRIGQVVRTFRH